MNSLIEFFKSYPKIALAFSGGVDSTYLMYLALSLDCQIKAYYVKTPFQLQSETDEIKQLTKTYGVSLEIISYDILQNDLIRENNPLRCYYCKKTLLEQIKSYALKDGYLFLMDGTNASDKKEERPGMKALKELKIYSPLQQFGFTKEKIRQKSKEAHLPTYNKPAHACLATRIPVNTEITLNLLQKIEIGENILKKLGFSSFRLRLENKGAKLQMPLEQFPLVLEKQAEIRQELAPYFENIALDLNPRISQ